MNETYELIKDLSIKFMYNNPSTTGIVSDRHVVVQYQNFFAQIVEEFPQVAEYIKNYIKK